MPNRLADCASLYLRKHADNPIDWYPWGEEALAKARWERRPIFLSIGYSSCHWCTVMEGEAFSDPAIAAYLNEHFVAIKVDREERPDLDSQYMQVLQMMAGSGGWPLNCFLEPDGLVPFYAGTYFSVEARYGRPGFLEILRTLRGHFDGKPEQIDQLRQQVLEGLQASYRLSGGSPLTADLREAGWQMACRVLTPNPGSDRNSFPMIPYVGLALGARHSSDPDLRLTARSLTRQRAMDLVLGGICDQAAGGFHRYTVDPTWTVPHFEKMLYDQGQILEFLSEVWADGEQDPAIRRAVEGCVGWLMREMTAPEGYFFAAQDADSFVGSHDPEPEEGAFYVFDWETLTAMLDGDQLAALRQEFTVSEDGNFEGRNVLQRRRGGDLSEAAESALAMLRTLRYGDPDLLVFPPARSNAEAREQLWPGRIPPVTDTKLIVAWNALTITGLARAAVVFDQPWWYQLAAGAARFIREHQSPGDRLHRLHYDGQVSVPAQAEDYALLIRALLDLEQAALVLAPEEQADWQSWAIALQREFEQQLGQPQGYASSNATRELMVQELPWQDNATPSANGIAAANLVRLFCLTDEPVYLERAEALLQACSGNLQQSPAAAPSLFAALDHWLRPRSLKANPEVLTQLARRWWPGLTLRRSEALPEGAIALLCEGLECRDPARTWADLEAQLQS